MQPSQPPQTSAPQGQYDFIMSPQKPTRNFNGLGLGGNQSLGMRIAMIGGGFVVLLLVVSVAINLLNGSDKSQPALLAVARQQQSIIHLTDGIINQQGISAANSSAGITIYLTVGSEQKTLFTYIKANKYKMSLQQVNLGIKPSLDTQLQNAQSAGTYNATFQTIMQAQLQSYQAVLKQAYPLVKGEHAKALLKADYDETTLLEQQLKLSAS